MQHIYHQLNPSSARSISTPKPDGVSVLEELIAEDGMKLTQADDVEIQERIIASAVMLGKGRTADEWKEITMEEVAEIEALQEQYRLEQEKLMESSDEKSVQ